MEGLGYAKALSYTVFPVLMMVLVRCLFARQTLKRFKSGDFAPEFLFKLPWKEAFVDFFCWEAIGLLVGAFYMYVLHAPLSTGAKVMVGCTTFGLLIGILSYLEMERQIITQFKSMDQMVTSLPQRIFPVGYKLLFFTSTMFFAMVGVILLMVYKDIIDLSSNKELFGPDSFISVFKEIVFAFLVFMVFNLMILIRYSRNLKDTFSVQVEVLEQATNGNYNKVVPVVSNDEFGIIAGKTNHMIAGLKDRDFCQLNFTRYMPEQIGRRILDRQIDQDGEIQDVTMLFCDLRGYTSLVEKSDPKDVVKFLNTYFYQMQQAITAHQGIVLQYIGDEIEAVFGYPLKIDNHAQKAVDAALEMRKRVDELNRENLSQINKRMIRHGIGIHTGKVLAGSVGSQDRLVYAMVGDTVNVASRIQVLNKAYGSDILISKVTKDRIYSDHFQFESLGPVDIRGRSESIEVLKIL